MRLDMNRLLASGHRYVIYDGHDLGQEFELLSLTVPVHPAITAVTGDIPAKPGTHLYGRRLAPRDITAQLAVRADTRDPLDISRAWRSKIPLVVKDEPKRLYLDDDFYCLAMAVETPSLEIAKDRGIVTITFRCFDPYFYGPTHEVELGRSARVFRPIGQANVWPVVTVTGASGTLQIRNVTTGDQVVIPNVSSSATVTVDMENAKAYVNGEFKPVDMSLTDFFDLEPEREYQITVSSGTGTLSYQERAL